MRTLAELTNKTKRELILLATGSLNQQLSFEVRDRWFTSYVGSILKMERSQAISYVSDMVNEPKLWDSLHSLNGIMRESGERFWYDREQVNWYKKQLETFLNEFNK